jgi:aspartate carbamoyltransferase catalytic subunit
MKTTPDTKGHLISVGSLDASTIKTLLDRAAKIKSGSKPDFSGCVAGLLFFEPSTRTRIGFHIAMARPGGTAIVLDNLKIQSDMSASESFDDTIRVLSGYCDVLIIRHPEPDTVIHTANCSLVPVINAGNGHEEHPTQCMVDLFAVWSWHGKIEDLKVAIIGDLAWSRCAHSLVLGLDKLKAKQILAIHPNGRSLPEKYRPKGNTRLIETDDLSAAIDADVIYMAGLPHGQQLNVLGKKQRALFAMTKVFVQTLPDTTQILCPLPRVDEIHKDVDALPNAGYFRQSDDALFVRMALLEQALSFR